MVKTAYWDLTKKAKDRKYCGGEAKLTKKDAIGRE